MYLSIPVGTIILLIVTAIVIGITIALYFLGKRADKKRAEQQEQLDAMAQQMSMLIIDKKKMKLKDAGLPEAVIAQTPWYAKGQKVPVVKVKVGPKVMTLLCDIDIYDEIPIKKEVKATVSGLYITSVRGLHGKKQEEAPKKKGLRAWAMNKRKELNNK